MSISTEITRLQNAKASIKTSIETKGVTVPSGAKLDDYSDYVDLIQTGGGTSKIKNMIERTATSLDANDFDGATKIGNYAFSSWSNLTGVTIPSSVTSIGQYAFQGCGFSSIILPTSVTSIENNAFYNCTRMTSVEIPTSVTSLGSGILYNCANLTSCTFNANVTKIPGQTFASCRALTSFVVPSTITEIGGTSSASFDTMVFYYCTSLTSVTIPNSVTTIGRQCFENCTNLIALTYQGTMSQWSSITLGTDWKKNSGLTTVHCSDGDITL